LSFSSFLLTNFTFEQAISGFFYAPGGIATIIARCVALFRVHIVGEQERR
jgi:hypothetical protein